MALKFRNLSVTPEDPVSAWGFEGMLAAIDRGYAKDWRKLIDAVAADQNLRSTFDAACVAAESRASVAVVLSALDLLERTPAKVARDDFVGACNGSRMTDGDIAEHLGISAALLHSYLSGQTTPAPAHHAEMERIAEGHRAPHRAGFLDLI